MEEETYYVNVREPAETRRALLETSRQVVIALQNYENFKLKRVKKLDLVEKLRKNFKEINELIGRLKKEMPQVKLRKSVSFVEEKKEKAPTSHKVSVPKGRREITDLERELNEIESKLRSLK